MQDTRPLLLESEFPPLQRRSIECLQANLGYRCNLSCGHCHVNAGPGRSEEMNGETVELLLRLVEKIQPSVVDLTGGAPELNRHFRHLVSALRRRDIEVIDRSNLTILFEPGQSDLAEFLAGQEVTITASLPCYREENVSRQRGRGVYADSIRALQKLNSLGYGRNPALQLNLVYNPLGAELPPPRGELERDYKRELGRRFGIEFNQLFTMTNMPISRFGAQLLAAGEYHHYLSVLRSSFQSGHLQTVMCRDLISVDWQGYVYDCDFNQMLELPIVADNRRQHLRDLLAGADMRRAPIRTGEHCYACTAGQGSSCGGALNA